MFLSFIAVYEIPGAQNWMLFSSTKSIKYTRGVYIIRPDIDLNSGSVHTVRFERVTLLLSWILT